MKVRGENFSPWERNSFRPNFIFATQHIRRGSYDDAIRCLEAVARAHEAAPESNLLLWTIYLDKKNDPICAVYFLRKYLNE
ncbi:MAG: hypothetical protein LBB18_04235 [Puniceicoccales bacterium]|nr:hypothetical protein [Puniceicoccales bacterium]